MPSKDIKDCVDELQQKWPLLKKLYEAKFKDCRLELSCTLRSVIEQRRLYEQGRTLPGQIVTHLDGVIHPSMHNPTPESPLSRAFDVMVFSNGKLTWDLTYYLPLVEFCQQLGLVSGGSWKTFKDYPHVEVKS